MLQNRVEEAYRSPGSLKFLYYIVQLHVLPYEVLTFVTYSFQSPTSPDTPNSSGVSSVSTSDTNLPIKFLSKVYEPHDATLLKTWVPRWIQPRPYGTGQDFFCLNVYPHQNQAYKLRQVPIVNTQSRPFLYVDMSSYNNCCCDDNLDLYYDQPIHGKQWIYSLDMWT